MGMVLFLLKHIEFVCTEINETGSFKLPLY